MGLVSRGRMGEASRGGGLGKALGLGVLSSGVYVVDGNWMGRPSDDSLDSVALRLRGGVLVLVDSMSDSGFVYLAAARVAGATEKRRPI